MNPLAQMVVFTWVTDAWRAVVPGDYTLWIGLLIAFHVGLGVFFSWFLTYYAAVMLVGMGLLLRAEWRPQAAVARAARRQHRLA